MAVSVAASHVYFNFLHEKEKQIKKGAGTTCFRLYEVIQADNEDCMEAQYLVDN